MDPSTSLEKTFSSAFDISGATGQIGNFMMIRTKLIVLGIVAALVMLTGMIVTSTMASKIKKTQRDGGCTNTKDLDKGYKWGLYSSIAYAGAMTLFGGLAIALIISMFI